MAAIRPALRNAPYRSAVVEVVANIVRHINYFTYKGNLTDKAIAVSPAGLGSDGGHAEREAYLFARFEPLLE